MTPAAWFRQVRDGLPRTFRVAQAFFPLARPHRRDLALALALAMVTAALEVLRPWPLQMVLDQVLLRRGDAPRPLGIDLGAWPLDRAVLAAAAGTALLALVAGAASYGQTLLLSNAGQRVVARLRRELFRHLLRLPLGYHTARRAGDLLMRLTGDIVLLRELVVGSAFEGTAAALTLLGTLAAMLWLDARLTLVSLAIVPALALAAGVFGERIRQAVRRTRSKEGEVSGHAAEALGAIAMIQAFGAVDAFDERFARENRSSLRAGLRSARAEALLARSLDLLSAIGTGVTLALGAWSVQHGSLTPGGLVVFLAYQRTLYRPLRQLARVVARSAKAGACGERVLEVLETPPGIDDAPGATACPPLRGEVRFEDVTLRYPRGDVALDRVSLHVPAGSVAVIRGGSGAGKSTLVSLLPRLLDPTSGRVTLDGTDVRAWTLDSLRARVAMVFQESVLLGLSVRENIALGDPGASEEAVVAAARRAGVLSFAERLPHGLDTRVGERGAMLSGGQRQRVALARAALRDAPLLVLDEPFAHLDEVSRDHVLAALREIARDRTVLLVTHQDHPGLEADLEVTMADGRILEVRDRVLNEAVS